ncbi:MAG: efflux transporter periplasmic adaptor subunit [Rhodospirillaceae bacterium]|nr:efflux transporter periplasmic adaptor subunit [Rhodospirillaceae bacterium]
MGNIMPNTRPSLSEIQNTNSIWSFGSKELTWKLLFRNKKTLIILVLLIIIFALYLVVFNSENNEIMYDTHKIELGNLNTSVVANGSLQPKNQVDVGSEISGLIEFVAVDDNDLVSKGDVLARLAKDQLNARVMQSRAQLTSAVAKVEEASASKAEALSNFRRAQNLFQKGNVSERALGTAEANFARTKALVVSASANVAVAEATLVAEETNLSKADIKAPIDGLVLTRQVEPGQAVAASFQTPVLFTLAENLAIMELIVDIDEADIGQVREGQFASFSVDAYPNRTFPASLISLKFAPKIIENVVTYEAVLAVDNSEYLLRPGMTATATIVTESRSNVMLVPYAALRFAPKIPNDKGVTQSSSRSRVPGLMGMMMPRMRSKPKSKNKVMASGESHEIWLLKGDKLESRTVALGLVDGQKAEIISAQVEPGSRVVTNSRSRQ